MSVDGLERPTASSGQGKGLDDPQSEIASPAPRLHDAKSLDQTPDLEIPNQTSETNTSMLPKLLRTTRTLLGSRSFFFSYELDITRRLGTDEKNSSEIPLHKSVDPLVSHWMICTWNDFGLIVHSSTSGTAI